MWCRATGHSTGSRRDQRPGVTEWEHCQLWIGPSWKGERRAGSSNRLKKTQLVQITRQLSLLIVPLSLWLSYSSAAQPSVLLLRMPKQDHQYFTLHRSRSLLQKQAAHYRCIIKHHSAMWLLKKLIAQELPSHSWLSKGEDSWSSAWPEQLVLSQHKWWEPNTSETARAGEHQMSCSDHME